VAFVPAPLFEWIQVLQRTDSGKLMLTNLLFAFRTNRPPRDTLRRTLSEVVARWSADGGRRADSVIEAIADELLEASLCGAPTVRIPSCSRVVDALSLVMHNIDYARLGFGVSDEVPPRLLDVLEHGIPEGAAVNSMRGRRPLAWVTCTEALDSLRETCEQAEFATIVRDRLGLNHYDEDELLLQVNYPPEAMETLEFAAPTFLEGGAGVIFRARFCEDSLGRTVDLSSLDDGLPEAVHRPVPFTARFSIRRIGRPRTAPGFEFNRVIVKADYPWTEMPEDFEAFLADCGSDT